MRKSKIVSLLLVFVMVFSFLAACNQPAPDPYEEPKPVVVPAEVIAAAVKEFLTTIPENNYIMAADAALKLVSENPDAVFLVDMRSAEDYAKGHIANAVNIPYAKIGELLEVIPMNKQVIFQCYSGQTSAQVTALAKILGFNAVSFRGGMNFGWTPLNLGAETLVTTESKLPAAKTPELSKEKQILWDAVKKYFTDKNYIIAPADLNTLIKDTPDAIYMLDIRSAEDFGKGHIATANHIAFKEVGANISKLPTNKPVYVTCYTGQTAGITIAPLRLMGINAMSLNRGMTGWTDAELPVVTK